MSFSSYNNSLSKKLNVLDKFYFRFNESITKEEKRIYADLVDKNFLKEMFNGTNFEHIRKHCVDFKILDDTFQTLTVKFLTFSRGYLSEILEKFLLEAHQHGIIEGVERKIYRFGNFNYKLESDLQVLTMYMLSAGFYIWLGTVAIACVVFVGEHIVFEVQVRLN